MAKSKSFSSVASSVWNKLPGHLSSISSLPAFRKKLKHHLFRSAFPGNPSPSTGITFLWCQPIHRCDSGRTHPTAWLTRSSWAPTISRHPLRESRLHTGARVNLVLLTYLVHPINSMLSLTHSPCLSLPLHFTPPPPNCELSFIWHHHHLPHHHRIIFLAPAMDYRRDARNWKRLKLAKVVKFSYRLHIGARVNAALLTYLNLFGGSWNSSSTPHFRLRTSIPPPINFENVLPCKARVGQLSPG